MLLLICLYLVMTCVFSSVPICQFEFCFLKILKLWKCLYIKYDELDIKKCPQLYMYKTYFTHKQISDMKWHWLPGVRHENSVSSLKSLSICVLSSSCDVWYLFSCFVLSVKWIFCCTLYHILHPNHECSRAVSEKHGYSNIYYNLS